MLRLSFLESAVKKAMVGAALLDLLALQVKFEETCSRRYRYCKNYICDVKGDGNIFLAKQILLEVITGIFSLIYDFASSKDSKTTSRL